MPATVPPALPNSNMLSMSHGTVNYLTHFLSMAFYNRFWIVSISMSGGRIFLTDFFFFSICQFENAQSAQHIPVTP